MAEALGDYESGGLLYLNGRLLAEVTSVDVKDMGNLNKVYTTLKGLAGTAAGPIETEMTIESAMPKAGAEADFARALNRRQTMTLRVRAEGQSISYSVRVNEVGRKFDANSAAVKTIAVIGKPIGVTT
jgi:hypothetical protein